MLKSMSQKINKQQLEALCSYDIEYADIAAVLLVSQSQLDDFIAQEYGLTPSQFVKKQSALGRAKAAENIHNLAKSSPSAAKYLHSQSKNGQNMTINGQNQSDISQFRSKILQKITKELQNDERFQQLSPKKQSFISNYLTSKNATKSAEAAGYSVKSAYSQGSRLLKNDEVAALIKFCTEREAELLSDDKSQILADLDEIIANCKREITLEMVESNVVNRRNPANTMISALALKAKIQGVEAPNKHSFTSPDGTEERKPIMYLPKNGRDTDTPA